MNNYIVHLPKQLLLDKMLHCGDIVHLPKQLLLDRMLHCGAYVSVSKVPLLISQLSVLCI